MKSYLAFFCGLIAAVAANAAAAAPFEQELRFPPLIQAPSPQSQPQGDAARPVSQRDPRAAGEADRGRMSPDERRQLRRDIQDAGKDIYRSTPQERRDARRSGRR